MSIKAKSIIIVALFAVVAVSRVWRPSASVIACTHTLCAARYDGNADPVARGRRLVQELVSPLSNQVALPTVRCCAKAHLYAIADILAYFEVLATAKGQRFCEGMFVVEDNSGRLFSFLHSYVGTYRRISSHFSSYTNQQYGLDIPFSYRSYRLFIAQKRHVLFGKLNEHLLFIKPENYGTRLAEPIDFIMHTKEYIQSLGRRLARLGFERSDWREERIPRTIMQAWRDFLHHWTASAHGVKESLSLAASYGIQEITARFAALKHTVESPTFVQCAASERLERLLQEYDHCLIRHGREVILRVPELLGLTH